MVRVARILRVLYTAIAFVPIASSMKPVVQQQQQQQHQQSSADQCTTLRQQMNQACSSKISINQCQQLRVEWNSKCLDSGGKPNQQTQQPTLSTPTPTPTPTTPSFTCVKANVLIAYQGNTPQPELIEGEVAQFDISLPPNASKTAVATATLTPPAGLALSRDSFSFNGPTDPTTYTVLVKLNAAKAIAIVSGTKTTIALNWKYPSLPDCVQSTQSITLKVTKKNGKTGQALGDPHIRTFDGVAFNLMKPGVFTLVKASNFQVQGAIRQCGGPNLGCVYGIAIQIGQSIARLVIEGNQLALARGTDTLADVSIEQQKALPNYYRVFVTSDPSTYVDVNMNKFAGGEYLDVTCRLSPYMLNNGPQGVFGNGNGKPADDERDATKVIAAYQVNGANLFTCATADCQALMKPTLESDKIKMDPVPLLHQGYTPVDVVSIPARSSVLGTSRMLRQESIESRRLALDESKINDLCRQVMASVPHCDKYVTDRSFFVESVCAQDTVLLSDMANIDEAKLAYLRECRREMDAAIVLNANTTLESMESATEDRARLSLATTEVCPDNCNGRGTCQLNGCKCETGFSGYACSIAL